MFRTLSIAGPKHRPKGHPPAGRVMRGQVNHTHLPKGTSLGSDRNKHQNILHMDLRKEGATRSPQPHLLLPGRPQQPALRLMLTTQDRPQQPPLSLVLNCPGRPQQPALSLKLVNATRPQQPALRLMLVTIPRTHGGEAASLRATASRG